MTVLQAIKLSIYTLRTLRSDESAGISRLYAPPTAPLATQTETTSAPPESGWTVTTISLCQIRWTTLHQVSVCFITSARHSQVRSPNMRTSHHIVAGSIRVVHVAPVSMVKCEGYERPANRKDAHPSETIMQQICRGRRFHLHRDSRG